MGFQMRQASKFILSALCAASLCSAASAAPVSVSNITGSWSDVDPAANGTITNNGTANPSLRWGTPATNNGQSGYDFNAAADTVVNVPPNSEFDLGTFTHINNPINSGTSIDSAKLTVSLDIEIDGVDQGSRDFIFDFIHDETPNGADPCANGEDNDQGVNINGCADLVSVTTAMLSENFMVNDLLYTITILGLRADGEFLSIFETIERKINTGTLVANVTVSEVPIPAALPLFLAGIAGLGFAGRGKKKQVKVTA